MAKRGKDALLAWCKANTQGYPGVEVANFTTSWRDGLAFCALLHKFKPTSIDFKKLTAADPLKNHKLAFDTAEKLGITRLLDPEDMLVPPHPEQLSVITYLSQYYHFFANTRADGVASIVHSDSPAQPQPRPPTAVTTSPATSRPSQPSVSNPRPLGNSVSSPKPSPATASNSAARTSNAPHPGNQPLPIDAPLCEKCKKPASGTMVTWQDNLFHTDCFGCTTCGRKFRSACLNIEGRPYCEGCGRKAFIQSRLNRRPDGNASAAASGGASAPARPESAGVTSPGAQHGGGGPAPGRSPSVASSPQTATVQKAEEEAKRRRESEDARKKEEEEKKRRASEDARRKEEEEKERRASEDAKKKEEEEKNRRASEDARKKEEEAKKRKAEEEAKERQLEAERKALVAKQSSRDRIPSAGATASTRRPSIATPPAQAIQSPANSLVSNAASRPSTSSPAITASPTTTRSPTAGMSIIEREMLEMQQREQELAAQRNSAVSSASTPKHTSPGAASSSRSPAPSNPKQSSSPASSTANQGSGVSLDFSSSYNAFAPHQRGLHNPAHSFHAKKGAAVVSASSPPPVQPAVEDRNRLLSDLPKPVVNVSVEKHSFGAAKPAMVESFGQMTSSFGDRSSSEDPPIWVQRAQRLGELRDISKDKPAQPTASATAQAQSPTSERASLAPAVPNKPPSPSVSKQPPRPSAALPANPPGPSRTNSPRISSAFTTNAGKAAVGGGLVQEINLDDLDVNNEEDVTTAVYRTTIRLQEFDMKKIEHGLHGWLKKRNQKFSLIWHDRYFSLQGYRLFYFKEQPPDYSLAREHPPEAFISLQVLTDIEVDSKQPTRFTLITTGVRWDLDAETVEDRDTWVEYIKDAATFFKVTTAKNDLTLEHSPISQTDMLSRKEGTLQRCGKFSKWKFRSFVLQDGLLSWYSLDSGERRGRMALYGCMLRELDPETFSFEVENSLGEKCSIAASDEMEMHGWLNSLLKQKLFIEEQIDMISF